MTSSNNNKVNPQFRLSSVIMHADRMTADETVTSSKSNSRLVDFDLTEQVLELLIYENMDIYITGMGTESSKKRAASQFLEVSNLSMEELKIRALIKDALYYRFITTKAGGWIEPIDSGIRLGKTPSECLEFLKNPENEESLMSLLIKLNHIGTHKFLKDE